jgi:hypothetical protein
MKFTKYIPLVKVEPYLRRLKNCFSQWQRALRTPLWSSSLASPRVTAVPNTVPIPYIEALRRIASPGSILRCQLPRRS